MMPSIRRLDKHDSRRYSVCPLQDLSRRLGFRRSITFHCLMPGATYKIGGQSALTGGSVQFHGEFRVEPGQVLDLGEVQVKARKR